MSLFQHYTMESCNMMNDAQTRKHNTKTFLDNDPHIHQVLRESYIGVVRKVELLHMGRGNSDLTASRVCVLGQLGSSRVPQREAKVKVVAVMTHYSTQQSCLFPRRGKKIIHNKDESNNRVVVYVKLLQAIFTRLVIVVLFGVVTCSV